MFRSSTYAGLVDTADVERRIHALERRLDRLSSTANRAATDFSSAVVQGTDRIGDVVAAAVSEVFDRFRGGARSVGSEAARIGNGAARRLSAEVEHRPLLMLGVAVGVGFLVAAVASRRR
jgi:ElaB/YqjD/DUF883 family membrane-anchored ribosome-binding protein